jgi:hypothetical protein
MKRTLKWTMAIVVILAAGKAWAGEPAFGEAGHVALSAERLFGYVHSKQTTSVAGTDMSQSEDSFSLFNNPLGAATGYSFPRLGVDVFIAPSISVGGSLGYFNLSPPTGSFSGFAFAPRLGFAARLGPNAAIWARGGITYQHVTTDPGNGGTSQTGTAFALTLEAPIAILVAPRAAFLIGPTLDLGLGGSVSAAGASTDRKFTDYGIQAGLLVLL